MSTDYDLSNDPLDTGTSEADQTDLDPTYPAVEEWVTEWFAPIIRHKLTTELVWCPEWWRHPEAISRLEGLWRAWESLKLDPTTGMSVWWRDHADHHLSRLLDRNGGPFVQCPAGHGGEAAALQVLPAPAGWWPDLRSEPVTIKDSQ